MNYSNIAMCLILTAVVGTGHVLARSHRPARPSGDPKGAAFADLHNFTNSPDGNSPIGGLAEDNSGNLFGVTLFGGSEACADTGCGVVFELSPAAGRRLC
ncbi:MAG TPA: hypothetical protein VHY79_16585 [Rhizomicrobium sp.]|nr:hypothetical protein [Rhizomicrobium sp.]